MNVLEEQIRLYAKQLKLPVFGEYQQFLRQAESNLDFGGLLLELMKAELASRQENQLKRRIKAAAFPYFKTTVHNLKRWEIFPHRASAEIL